MWRTELTVVVPTKPIILTVVVPTKPIIFYYIKT